MKKILLSILVCLTSQGVFANTVDLELPNEIWLGKWTAYVCEDGNTLAAVQPSELEAYNVEFNHIGTDYTLDNVIIKANFEENGVQCSYSGIFFADNAAWTIELRESRALPEASCLNGKTLIDSTLEFNEYKYLHGRAAIFAPFSNAATACADGTGKIGIHFQVTGRK